MSGTLSTISDAVSTVAGLFGGSGLVQLDRVTFASFEVPEKITWGGQQQLTVHKLIGGARVIDAMGRDDQPLSWSGYLQGSNATLRARQIDELRLAGNPISLTWGDFNYTVVIQSFECDFTKPHWQPYRLSCVILRDEAQGDPNGPLSLVDQVKSDIGNALGINVDAVASGVSQALGTAQQAASVIGRATGNTALSAAVSQAQGLLQTGVSSANSALSAASRISVGVGSLSGLASAAGAAAQGTAALGIVGRLANNVRGVSASIGV